MTELTLVEKLFAGLDFPAWTLVALVYAFIGWFYESTIFSLCEQGKFMDRGVFIGPLCPIYCMVCTFSYDLFYPIEECGNRDQYSGADHQYNHGSPFP